MPTRLQILLAQNADISRRAADEAIALGKVKVNGSIATPGTKVETRDKISMNGIPIRIKHIQPAPRVLAYHKPIGEECSRGVARSVFDNLPEAEQRWLNIGRLDINTSGLLLFTHDGQLAHRLTHPSFAIDREYAVRVYGTVNATTIEKLRESVMLEDGEAQFLDLIDCGGGGTNRWFYVVVQQGRNRLVRRLWESQGTEVSKLIRVRFATIVLATSLKPGNWSELSAEEISDLYTCVQLSPPLATTTNRRVRQTNRLTRQTGSFRPRPGIVADVPRQQQPEVARPPTGKTVANRTKVVYTQKKNPHERQPKRPMGAKPLQAAHTKDLPKHADQSRPQHTKKHAKVDARPQSRYAKPHKVAATRQTTEKGRRHHQDSNRSKPHSTTRKPSSHHATGSNRRAERNQQQPPRK